jgi:hypothetical protein
MRHMKATTSTGTGDTPGQGGGVTMYYPDDFARLTVLSGALGDWLAGLLHLRGRTAVHNHVTDVDNLRGER